MVLSNDDRIVLLKVIEEKKNLKEKLDLIEGILDDDIDDSMKIFNIRELIEG